MLPSSRNVTDEHGSLELLKTAVLASRSPKHIPESQVNIKTAILVDHVQVDKEGHEDEMHTDIR
ncbi:hypothetical protein DPMN_042956 [Dreissena polymorpha]|uniref:Uncharacterized protein n=1 Tax=Dreissena polymorpha TaxID=45954 RepID=A0A9D4CZK5_DREPO|nr:hypothetical protein DPMN_042956 [Dreissena polymorpha]